MNGDVELAAIIVSLGIVAGAGILAIGMIVAAGRIKKGLEK